MANSPLLSVLMTAYNREKYIGEAIDSVLSSTFTNFELIIVDDCSTDNTVAIAQSYYIKDDRIKIFVNDKNIGDYPNRNRAANYAIGKYLKYVDSDDKIYPDGLNYCVQSMENCCKADWAIISPKEISTEFMLNPQESIESHFFRQPFLQVGPGGTILNRTFFLKIGMYPTLYGPANDMYFNLLAASLGNVLLLKDNFLFYRRHEEQEINNQYVYLYNNYKYIHDALNILPLGLPIDKVDWLRKKNKRRFTVNIFNYFFSTYDIKKTKSAINRAGFTLRDALEGMFH